MQSPARSSGAARIGVLVATAWTLLAASSGGSALPATGDDRLTTEVRGRLERLLGEFPGLSAAISRDGAMVVSTALGRADLEVGVAASTDTRYLVHSAAKAWTAAAAVTLLEEGRLRAGDEVATLVEGWPATHPPITVMQLATHTGGLRHYRDADEARNPGRCDTVAEALPIFAADPLEGQPGGAESYSSWGFVLLSAAIEAAAGTSFDEALRERVLQPAGMVSTVHAHPAAVIADRATPYRRAEGGGFAPVVDLDSSCKWGAGGYLATAEDLVRFYLALLDHRVVGESSVELLLRGAPVVRFGGASEGGRSQILVDRERGVIAAVAANARGGDVDLHQVLVELVELTVANEASAND
ncbi:MAG TPA: serine hydrolase domain-containing protein [Thermoanaerobaculia bacterium]|nr:serine hydrolase domain-containing protein [Thermoanaerobaculia bacterium]